MAIQHLTPSTKPSPSNGVVAIYEVCSNRVSLSSSGVETFPEVQAFRRRDRAREYLRLLREDQRVKNVRWRVVYTTDWVEGETLP